MTWALESVPGLAWSRVILGAALIVWAGVNLLMRWVYAKKKA